MTAVTNRWLTTLGAGQDLPHAVIYAASYVWVGTLTSPGQLIKINPSTGAIIGTLTFPSDSKHNAIYDLAYDPTAGRILVPFNNSGGTANQVTISAVNPADLSYTDAVDATVTNFTGGCQSICFDTNYIYLASLGGIHRYDRGTYANHAYLSIAGGANGHAIRSDGTAVYYTTSASPGRVFRIDPATFTVVDEDSGAFTNQCTDDFAFTDDYLWVGLESGAYVGQIFRVDKSDLTSYTQVSTGQTAACFCVYSDGTWIYGLFDTTPGTMLKINPSTLAVIETYRFSTGPVNEMVNDGGVFYFTAYQAPGLVLSARLSSSSVVRWIAQDLPEHTDNQVGTAASVLSSLSGLTIAANQQYMFMARIRRTAGSSQAVVYTLLVNGTHYTSLDFTLSTFNEAGDGIMQGWISTKSILLECSFRSATTTRERQPDAIFDGVGGNPAVITSITSLAIAADAKNASITVASCDFYLWRLVPLYYNDATETVTGPITDGDIITIDPVSLTQGTPFISTFLIGGTCDFEPDFSFNDNGPTVDSNTIDLNTVQNAYFFPGETNYLRSGVMRLRTQSNPFPLGHDMPNADITKVAIISTLTGGQTDIIGPLKVYPLIGPLAGSYDTEVTSSATGFDAATLGSIGSLSIPQNKPLLLIFENRTSRSRLQGFGLKVNSTQVITSKSALTANNIAMPSSAAEPASGIAVIWFYPGKENYTHSLVGFAAAARANDSTSSTISSNYDTFNSIDDNPFPDAKITSVTITGDAINGADVIATKNVKLFALPTMAKLNQFKFRKAAPPLPPSGPFADKCAASGVIAGIAFDKTSNVFEEGFSFPVQPMTYSWGTGACDITNPGGNGNGSITFARSAGERLNLAVEQNGQCYFPEIDNTTYYSTGGGTGALKLTIPSNSNSTTGGYVWLPFGGLGTSIEIGPDHANGGIVYIQYYQRWSASFVTAILQASPVFPSSKQPWFFGNPPNGSDSSDFEITPAIRGNGGIFQMSGQQGNDPYETNVGGTIYLENAALCAYIGGGVYGDYVPPCMVVAGDTWYECTFALQLRPVAYDFVVSGVNLTRAATFDATLVGKQVYIVGDGFYTIATYINAAAVTLTVAPTAGSGKAVYIANYPNSRVQSFIDGVACIDFQTAKIWWGTGGSGDGFGSIKFQAHMTGKDATIAHAAAYTWIDDVVVSTEPIEMLPPTPLQTLISSLAAGTWGTLATSGMDAAFAANGASGIKNPYAMEPVYDTTRAQVHFLGADHLDGSSPGCHHLRYDVATNAWTDLGVPGGWSEFFVHGYHITAINVSLRRLYRQECFNSPIHVWDLDSNSTVNTGDWALLPSSATGSHTLNSLCAFPERGTLLYSYGSAILEFNEGSQTWANVTPVGFDLDTTWEWQVHNPVLHQVLMGASNNKLWKYSSGGTFTQLTDIISTYRTYDGSGYNGVWTVDGTTGLYLVLTDPTNGTGRNLYTFDSATGVYTLESDQLPAKHLTGNIVACSLTGLGASMWSFAQSSGGYATGVYIRRDG